jgi:uncharacterized membrane protein
LVVDGSWRCSATGEMNAACRQARVGRSAMRQPWILVAFVAAMIIVIVGLDVILFRDHFWERLLVNIGIVLVFGAFYLRFFRPI